MNQLFDICLHKAIVDYPLQVKELKKEISDLKRLLDKATSEKNNVVGDLSALKNKVREKFQIEIDLAKMVDTK